MGLAVENLEERALLSGEDVLVGAGMVYGETGQVVEPQLNSYTQQAGGVLGFELGDLSAGPSGSTGLPVMTSSTLPERQRSMGRCASNSWMASCQPKGTRSTS